MKQAKRIGISEGNTWNMRGYHKEYSEAPNQLPQAGEVRADKRNVGACAGVAGTCRSVRGSCGSSRDVTGCHGT